MLNTFNLEQQPEGGGSLGGTGGTGYPLSQYSSGPPKWPQFHSGMKGLFQYSNLLLRHHVFWSPSDSSHDHALAGVGGVGGTLI